MRSSPTLRDRTVEPVHEGELYDLIYEESPGAILSMDPHGRSVAVNRAAVQLLARSRSEVAGTAFLEHVLAGDRARVKQRLTLALEGRVVDERFRITRGDGATRAVHLHAVPIVTDDGLERVELFLQDVTGTPFGSADDPAFYQMLERVPGQFTLLLDRNARIRRSSGLAQTHWLNDGDCMGRSYTLLLAPEESNRHALEELLHERAADESWSGTVWHARADGLRFPVRIFAMPYCDPRTNEFRGNVLVGRDTSAEQELIERTRRLERLATVGELVASVAAELQRALDAAFPHAETMQPRLREMRRLLESIGAFTSALVAGTDVRTSVAEEVRNVVRELHESYGVAAQVELLPQTPPIGMDAAHLRLAVRELVRNALEASPSGAQVQVRVEPHNAGVRVRVSDSGPGLPALTRDRALEPFTTTKPGHLGLGLAIARGIAALYDGRLQLLPATPHGVIAELELPPNRPDASVFRPMPMLLSRGRSVLVVDDDDSIRRLLRTVLERVGYRVQEAWSGRSALAAVTQDGAPDVLLTDIKMGGGSGFWLLTQLRRYEPRLLERTLIITGCAEDEEVAQLSLNTGCPVVRKPVDFHLLIELMNDLLLRSASATA